MNDTAPVILQVLPALHGGGVERSTIEMTQAIARAGGVALVASAGGRLVRAIERAGGEHVTLPLGSKNPWRIWRNAGKLAALIRERQVRIVHARSRAPAWSAWFACRRTGAIFVTTCHGIYGDNVPFKHVYNRVMARGARVIANSDYMARHIVARYGIPPERLRVIPRGLDPAVFDPDAVAADRMARLAQGWRLPDGVPTIMLPGRIAALKGQDVVLRALALMRHKEAVCVLVGGAEGRPRALARLERLIAELGLNERVRMAGHCEDMPAALMLSDVVVNASVEPESFGRTIIEAQAMRRMVVATAHGGALETVTQDVTGWLVPPGDAAALAEQLDAVLDMPEEARALVGERARAQVEQHYTVRAMQDATIAAYAELLAPESTAATDASLVVA